MCRYGVGLGPFGKTTLPKTSKCTEDADRCRDVKAEINMLANTQLPTRRAYHKDWNRVNKFDCGAITSANPENDPEMVELANKIVEDACLKVWKCETAATTTPTTTHPPASTQPAATTRGVPPAAQPPDSARSLTTQPLVVALDATIDMDFSTATTEQFKTSYHEQLKQWAALKLVALWIESTTTTVGQGRRTRRAGTTLSTVLVFGASADSSAVLRAVNIVQSSQIPIVYGGQSYTADFTSGAVTKSSILVQVKAQTTVQAVVVTQSDAPSVAIIISIAAVLGLMVVAGTLAFMYGKYSARQAARTPYNFGAMRKELQQSMPPEAIALGRDASGNPTDDTALDGTPAALCSLTPRELKRGWVRMVTRLGIGEFGEVWKALLDDKVNETVPEYTVAAKTVLPAQRGSLDSTAAEAAAEEALLKEALLMSQVAKHSHLVSIIGVITRGKPKILILSYCEHGACTHVFCRM